MSFDLNDCNEFKLLKEQTAKQKFDLSSLENIVLERKRQINPNSFTCRLLKDEKLLTEKLEEEADELIETFQEKGRKEIIWETADLLYFLIVMLASKGISLNDVNSELQRRSEEK